MKVRDNEDITASIEHLPSKKGTIKTIRETPAEKTSLIKTAFVVRSNPAIAKESTIPIFDANETTTEEECGTVITIDLSSNAASWSVTSDYVCKSSVLFATLSGKGGDFG